MNKPAVSVIIPCFNMGNYVIESIDSALAQTYSDLEIIVVNDGSTDDLTNDVLENLDRPRTRVLHTENRGLPAARNLAIQHSEGRYICALDADDRLHPQFLEKTIAILDREPEIAFVSTWLEAFGTESWVWRQERCDFPALLAECTVLTASPFRKEIIDEVGGYDTKMPYQGEEDWDFWISLVERGYKGTIIPEALFYYRQRPDSMRRMCEQPERRKQLRKYIIDKHSNTYRRFSSEVYELEEQKCGAILRENLKLEKEIEELKAIILDKTIIRDQLDSFLKNIKNIDAVTALSENSFNKNNDEELFQAYAEIKALRSSYSWKITYPLRCLYDKYLSIKKIFNKALSQTEQDYHA